MDKTDRRALTLALPILGEMPTDLQPESEIADVRRLVDGKSTDRPDRDDYLVAKAVATALAFRAYTAMDNPIAWPAAGPDETTAKKFQSRIDEFASLFRAVGRLNPGLSAYLFSEACARIGQMKRLRR